MASLISPTDKPPPPGRQNGVRRSTRRCPREHTILEGNAPRSETTGAYDRSRARGCRRCTRVLEGARGGLAKDPRSTLLGTQDRQCFEQVAEQPTREGQARIGGDLDGRYQEGCSRRIRHVRRNLRHQTKSTPSNMRRRRNPYQKLA